MSEVRSAEAVMAVRNSISSGHNILSTIHADKAESIPSRLYSLLESNVDLEQFLRSIHRYVQLGVHIKGYYSQKYQKFHREVAEVTEFYVSKDNEPKSNVLYKKTPDGKVTLRNPTEYLIGYLESQGVIMPKDILVKEEFKEPNDDLNNNSTTSNQQINNMQNNTPKSQQSINYQQMQTIQPIAENAIPVTNQVNNIQQNPIAYQNIPTQINGNISQ